MKEKITAMARDVHKEENFQEALREAHRCVRKPEMRWELEEVMDQLRGQTLTETDSIHSFMVASLAEYLDNHDLLPPLESVPDMHSTSEYFLQLQEIFRKKAQHEFDEFRAILERKLNVRNLW